MAQAALLRMRRVRRCLHTPRQAIQARALHAHASSEIQRAFLQFFADQDHTVVPSAPLVPPGNDTSLLFTNAGMVPFKQVFLGAETRPYVRATSAQRCVRAGGKHNDLEQVGRTRRHQTQFTMLGNFSFGDYFKADAIDWSWRFLTKELGLPRERMHVTVLHQDDEARRLWRQIAGLPASQIWSLDEKDNFWAMGDSGPCGPCSEIFWDLGDHIADPDERYLELWNLVFMQYFRNEGDASGTLHGLPAPCVDTGMGLERIASVLQQVPSNFHTDAFVPLLHVAATVLDQHRSNHATQQQSFAQALAHELAPGADRFGASAEIETLRIVADHLKTSYALLGDGVFPSNVGRGYVLRRIIRRAKRNAQKCGVTGTCLADIVLPEWETQLPGFRQMNAIIANEERAFDEMLATGTKAFDKLVTQAQQAKARVISGEDAFRLYDTFGIPLDIAQVLAEEHGLSIDVDGFERARKEHKRIAAASNVFASNHGQVGANNNNKAGVDDVAEANAFVGYDSLRVREAMVLSTWEASKEDNNGKTKGKAKATTDFWVALDPCPFYPEGGGQVGDRGVLRVNDLEVAVTDTKKLPNDVIAVRCQLSSEAASFERVSTELLTPGVTVDAQVDESFRAGCAVHHTATHLLQSALKYVLGDHVTQAGSFVTTDRLRFDFAHFGALSLEELERVQARVNELALANVAVHIEELAREEAERSGAICNFGEKYGDVVRVVRVGAHSSEFCGGTHVANSAAVFPFVILSEGSVAAGTRRMEAIGGLHGAQHLQTKDATLHQLAAQLGTTPAKVPERVAKLQKQIKGMDSVVQALSDALASLPPAPFATGRLHSKTDEGALVHVHELLLSSSQSELVKVLRRRAEFLLQNEPDAVHFVLMGATVACISNGEHAHAGQVLQRVLKAHNGRGGGNAQFAQGTFSVAPTRDELRSFVME
ncbi:TPA: hypothetical protein N0F65_007135 [Lagenidium giganteum]|uniref:Alanine--tRNA ligase n=1 Tax=Lagenidium giganteum TaxID=4803 RepID=A0AAV2YX10_9STRA|nr:TPA: hypothetical protein N0F65_007135 [Lagenidium giganteum]